MVEEVVDEVVGKKVADTATELEERADVKEVAGQEAAGGFRDDGRE